MISRTPRNAVTAAGRGVRLGVSLDGSLLTFRDWLRFGVSLFNREQLAFGQGATNAFDEALWLLRHTLHLPRDGWEVFLDARLIPAEKRRLREVLERRAFAREPTAYITGEAWLGEFSFRVDKRVIIPRSYFLEIIPEQINPWFPDPEAVTRAADVCTGSGCLAILLANAFPNAAIDATDISADALEVAAANIADYNLQERITLHRADVFEPPTAQGRARAKARRQCAPPPQPPYDLIICNPPYEPDGVLETLPPEFRREPAGALVSGADGLDIIRKLLPQAAARLAPGGVLAVEIGALHDALQAEWRELETHWLPVADESDCIALFQAAALKKCFPPTVR